MFLQSFNAVNIRNLNRVKIDPSPHINVIFGPNASGKTSLLEAIHMLSCGRSFRTHHLGRVLAEGSTEFAISGHVADDKPPNVFIGVQFQDRHLMLKAQGVTLKRSSELASYLPIVVIQPECHRIFTHSPEYRRKFLDWGVFHVEPDFLQLWHRYRRVLRQRNAMLSRRVFSSSVWDKELNQTAEGIHALRKAYIIDLLDFFTSYIEQLLRLEGSLSVDYRPGWQEELGFAELLIANAEADRTRGYTQIGPHRADIVFKVNGKPLHEAVSRGQQKMTMCALYLAQAATYKKRTGKSCVLLLDDIKAELDQGYLVRLAHILGASENQVFVTSTERLDFDGTGQGAPQKKMFHVERGVVQQVI